MAYTSLPMELISEILSKLPLKNVIRLKTVNKSWNILISSRHFSRQHFISQSKSSHFDDRIFVFVGTDGCLYYSKVDPTSNAITPNKINVRVTNILFNIVGSCNGLILCTAKRSLVVVNPTTLQHKSIPKFELSFKYYHSHSYGFGYDSETNDFKIVCVVTKQFRNDCPDGNEVGVYSLNSNSWKTVGHDLGGGVCIPFPGVVVNKHLVHWLFCGIDSECCVLPSFDVCTEQWSRVPLPASNLTKMSITLHGFDGGLFSKIIGFPNSMFLMDAYGDRESWVKVLDCFDELFEKPYYAFPLLYSESKNEVFVSMHCRFYWCDLTLKTLREVEFHNVCPRDYGTECIRSLAQLPGCG